MNPHTAIRTCIPANGIGSRAYARSGCYIMRSGSDYMMIRCGRVPFAGVSTHYHNDALSFELQAGGVDFIIDPGTYVYTADPAWRNHFRSTAAHNTPVVNGQEQNAFEHSVFDYLGDNARARCLEWKSSAEEDVFVGEHVGFRVSNRVVCVRRSVKYAKSTRRWQIDDDVVVESQFPRVVRNGAIQPFAVKWRFHLHPEVKIERDDSCAGVRLIHTSGSFLHMGMHGDGLRISEERDWVSFRYGHKEPATVLWVEKDATNSCEGHFVLSAGGD